MPDITMCQNETCLKRFCCYRFMAKPDSRQSYANFKLDGIKCEYFMPISKTVVLNPEYTCSHKKKKKKKSNEEKPKNMFDERK